MKMDWINYLDMFSGIGGFALGILQAGVKIKKHWHIEIDKHCCKVYHKHFPDSICLGDARDVSAETFGNEKIDVLTAGFPCQSFSIAGKRKGMSGEDTRGTLFFEIWRLARELRPRILLLENVPGLLSSRDGEDFYTIIKSLDEIGYVGEWTCLNTRWWLPQNRERVFILAYPKGCFRGERRPQIFPFGEGNKVSKEADGGKREGRAWVSSTIDSRYGSLRNSRETYIQNKRGIRRFTPMECERLQGFPYDWTEGCSDTQRYKMLGNAVSVPVIRAIFEGKREFL